MPCAYPARTNITRLGARSALQKSGLATNADKPTTKTILFCTQKLRHTVHDVFVTITSSLQLNIHAFLRSVWTVCLTSKTLKESTE